MAGAAGSAASEVNSVGKGMQNAAKAAKAAKAAEAVEARAAKAVSHVAQDAAHDASKVSKSAANASHDVAEGAAAAKNAKTADKQLGSGDRAYWKNTKPEGHNPLEGRDGVKREVSDISGARAAKKSPAGPETPPTGGAASDAKRVVANDNEPIKAQKIAVGDTTGTDSGAAKAVGPKGPGNGPGEPKFLRSEPTVRTPETEPHPTKAEPTPAKPAAVPAQSASGSHYGNWKTDDVMRGSKYTPTQRDVYRGTVEEMADAMKAKKFDWAKSKVDPIIVDKNGKILSGHHRIVAARLAKEPIPPEAIKVVDKVDTIRDTRPWTQVTVRQGTKP